MSPFRQQSGRMFAAGFALLAVTGPRQGATPRRPDMVSKDGTCLTGGGFVDFGVDSILTVRVDGELETGDELIVYDSSLCGTDAPATYELLLCMVGGYGLPNCLPGITGRGQTRLKVD